MNECAVDVCGYSSAYQDWTGEYDGYYFDEYESMCYCYSEGDVAREQYII
jgi:hypothetical protein